MELASKTMRQVSADPETRSLKSPGGSSCKPATSPAARLLKGREAHESFSQPMRCANINGRNTIGHFKTNLPDRKKLRFFLTWDKPGEHKVREGGGDRERKSG